jgi:hypothetical protein
VYSKTNVIEVNKFYQVEQLLRKNFTIAEISELLNISVEDVLVVDDLMMFESQNSTYGNA